jgi:hypothetical protein
MPDDGSASDAERSRGRRRERYEGFDHPFGNGSAHRRRNRRERATDPSQKMDEQAGGNNQAVERNPSGAPVGSKSNPSPTVGAGGMQSGNPGSVRKQDESAGGNGGAVERNPDGSTGGSKSNPSPR